MFHLWLSAVGDNICIQTAPTVPLHFKSVFRNMCKYQRPPDLPAAVPTSVSRAGHEEPVQLYL